MLCLVLFGIVPLLKESYRVYTLLLNYLVECKNAEPEFGGVHVWEAYVLQVIFPVVSLSTHSSSIVAGIEEEGSARSPRGEMLSFIQILGKNTFWLSLNAPEHAGCAHQVASSYEPLCQVPASSLATFSTFSDIQILLYSERTGATEATPYETQSLRMRISCQRQQLRLEWMCLISPYPILSWERNASFASGILPPWQLLLTRWNKAVQTALQTQSCVLHQARINSQALFVD